MLPLSFTLFTSFIFLSYFRGSNAEVVSYTLNISYFSGSPDGIQKDKILGINNQYPGPTLVANQGDTLEIKVINNIQDGQNTSLHWHGISQRNWSLFEDGTSQISQCPLPSGGNSQTYKFKVDEAGTFWYHSHHFSQYSEGLFGALIVHAKKEAYTYDDELTIILSDWYHQTAHENEKWHVSCTSRGVPPYPDAGLMNGLGRYPCNFSSLAMEGRAYDCDADKQMRPVFHLDLNKTYRLRLINAAAVAAFNVSIDEHTLQTIEVDGIDVKQTPKVFINVAPIAAGQRYSFLFKCSKYNVSNETQTRRYLIRANLRKESLMLLPGKNINEHPEALMGDVTGVIECFDGEKDTRREMESSEKFTWNDTVPPLIMSSLRTGEDGSEQLVHLNDMDLHPLDGSQAPSPVDKEFTVDVHFEEDRWNVRKGSFNNSPFILPDHKPLLMSVIDNEPIPKTVFPLEINDGDVVQLVINNPFYGPHPFHLHGHHFWVVGMGMWDDGNYTDVNAVPIRKLTRNGVKRDTVLVQEKSWAVIRFKADNPGVWLFHCHIDWHNLSGMSLVFIEAADKVREQARVSDEAKRVCAMHNNVTMNMNYE